MSDGETTKRGRGRPKGSTAKPKGAAASKAPKKATRSEFPEPHADNESVEPGHNQPKVAKDVLTDEQEMALTVHHAKNYEKLLAAKKKSDAAFRNGCKLAKAEGVPLKQIKEYISFQTEEGQQQLREDLARKQKVALWAGMPIGTQINFLEEIDRTPIDDRTFHDGKTAGLKGEKAEVPRHVPASLTSKWIEGWHEGQRILMERIKQKNDDQRQEDAAAFDGPPSDELPDLDGNEDEEPGED